MISIIVAQAHNRVIGNKGDQPFYLPADLRHFRELTTGHTVIMGRKTYEAIHNRLGHALPNRTNIVISRTLSSGDDYTVAPSLEAALALLPASDESFIIGGAQVYEAAIPKADRIYLTQVEADLDGDTHFPELSGAAWHQSNKETHSADSDNQYDYTFITLERTA
jgi:dihydrofolate reductase